MPTAAGVYSSEMNPWPTRLAHTALDGHTCERRVLCRVLGLRDMTAACAFRHRDKGPHPGYLLTLSNESLHKLCFFPPFCGRVYTIALTDLEFTA